jgi:hypothetical protein
VSLSAAQLERLRQAAAAAGQPQALFAGIGRIAAEAMGCALFTVMRLHENAMEVERLYSTDTAAYPVGGRKAKRDTPWGRQVLSDRRIFVGEGEAAIRAAFDDHATILGLGLRAIVNVPVVYGDVCLGTVNFLKREAAVSSDDVATATALALIATPALAPGRK